VRDDDITALVNAIWRGLPPRDEAHGFVGQQLEHNSCPASSEKMLFAS
jgi:hypothetical protein